MMAEVLRRTWAMAICGLVRKTTSSGTPTSALRCGSLAQSSDRNRSLSSRHSKSPATYPRCTAMTQLSTVPVRPHH